MTWQTFRRPSTPQVRRDVPMARIGPTGRTVYINATARQAAGLALFSGPDEPSCAIALLYAADPTPTLGIRAALPEEVEAGTAFRLSSSGTASIAGLLDYYGHGPAQPGPRTVIDPDVHHQGPARILAIPLTPTPLAPGVSP